MKKTRAAYEPWLRDYVRKRQPDLEPPLLAAIDAFDTIQDKHRLDATLLAPIVEAASSSRRALYENVTGFLGQLTGEYALAQALREWLSTRDCELLVKSPPGHGHGAGRRVRIHHLLPAYCSAEENARGRFPPTKHLD
jgi:hypothetical protein